MDDNDEKKIDLRVDTDLPASSNDRAVAAAAEESAGTDTVAGRDPLAAVAGVYLCAIVFLAIAVLMLVGYRQERDHSDQAVVLRVAYRHEYADWAPTCVPQPQPLANSSQMTLARCEAIATAPTVLTSGVPCVSQFPSLCRPVYRNVSRVFADIGVVRQRYVAGTSNPHRYEPYTVVLESLDSGAVCDRLDSGAATVCVEQWLDATRNRTATRRVWSTKNGPKLDDASQLDQDVAETTVWTVLAALWLSLQCCVVVGFVCRTSKTRGSAFWRAHLRCLCGCRHRVATRDAQRRDSFLPLSSVPPPEAPPLRSESPVSSAVLDGSPLLLLAAPPSDATSVTISASALDGDSDPEALRAASVSAGEVELKIGRELELS